MTQPEPAALVHAAPDTSALSVLTPSLGSSPRLSCIPTSGEFSPSAAASGNAPQIVEQEALSHALGAVRALTETLLSPIRAETRLLEAVNFTPEGIRQLEQLPRILHGWRLPSIPLDPLARPLSLDDSLLRYEIAWIHLSCVKSSSTSLHNEVADTGKRFEEMLDQTFSIRVLFKPSRSRERLGKLAIPNRTQLSEPRSPPLVVMTHGESYVLLSSTSPPYVASLAVRPSPHISR
jgi:hypothetical protein